jgi:hypothetical protein
MELSFILESLSLLSSQWPHLSDSTAIKPQNQRALAKRPSSRHSASSLSCPSSGLLKGQGLQLNFLVPAQHKGWASPTDLCLEYDFMPETQRGPGEPGTSYNQTKEDLQKPLQHSQLFSIVSVLEFSYSASL